MLSEKIDAQSFLLLKKRGNHLPGYGNAGVLWVFDDDELLTNVWYQKTMPMMMHPSYPR